MMLLLNWQLRLLLLRLRFVVVVIVRFLLLALLILLFLQDDLRDARGHQTRGQVAQAEQPNYPT